MTKTNDNEEVGEPSQTQLAAAQTLLAAGWRYQAGFGPTVDEDNCLFLEISAGDDLDPVQGAVDRNGVIVGLGGSREDYTAEEAIEQAAEWIRGAKDDEESGA